MTTNVQQTRRDIEETLGLVPAWMDGVPPAELPLIWGNLKGFELNPATAIPPKYKELIGLGVSSQIPCRFCILFHTEAAKLNGATQAEIHEAIYQASLTRQLSTIVNGLETDFEEFTRETNQIVAYVKKQAEAQAVGRVSR
ncbi:MAG: carboxymuconolactone decarboxylase family protein [Thermoplasmatota archaeon]